MEVCTRQLLLLGSPQGQALRQRRELVAQGQAWLCLHFTHSLGELGYGTKPRSPSFLVYQ